MSEDHDKNEVHRVIDDLRGAAKSYTIDDIKGGGWFVRFLHHCIDTYAKKVNAQYFKNKYPGLPPDLIVSRQIELAKKYAAVEGGLSGGAYSAAVAATIGSGGGASPITGPAALASFTVDLLFTTQLQFRLAYDMAVLYGAPLDTDDPEDLVDLLGVAFGIKAGEIAREALLKAVPEAVQQGVKGVFKGAVLEFMKALPVIGKYLLQRNLIKFAIPLVNVPLSAGMNYWWTGSIAKRAREIYRNRAALNEEAIKLVASVHDHRLLLRVVWFITQADGKYTEGEAVLMRSIARQLAAHGESDEILKELEGTINLDSASIAADIKALPEPMREHLFHAAVVGAAADREVSRSEVDALASLATMCGVGFEPGDVRREVERLRGASGA
jgi:uncharacterized protein (DUF697 family)